MQTISSANLKIMNIVSRWPGATHDQTIFRQSIIHDQFEAGDFEHYILVGDSGYANTFFLATPYTANNNELAHDIHMQSYQAAVISTRNVVERQYGVIKRQSIETLVLRLLTVFVQRSTVPLRSDSDPARVLRMYRMLLLLSAVM